MRGSGLCEFWAYSDFADFLMVGRLRLSSRGAVVQLVRIPACHAGGRGFESRPLRQHFKDGPLWPFLLLSEARCSIPFVTISGHCSLFYYC